MRVNNICSDVSESCDPNCAWLMKKFMSNEEYYLVC